MHTPELPNYYALIWTLVNILLLLVPIVLIIGLVWYIKQNRLSKGLTGQNGSPDQYTGKGYC